MSTLRIFSAATALAVAICANAQDIFFEEYTQEYDPEGLMKTSIIEDTQLMYIGQGDVPDSLQYRSLINQYYEDQFRHSQDPRAPYFMLMSRNGNLAMGIGGDLKVVGAYDWDGSQQGIAFVPYRIAIPGDPSQRNLFQLTPSRTGIFFSVFGNDPRFGKFQVYIHGRFNGISDSFTLERAYASVGDWTFGYTKSTFDDPIAQPASIDIEGPNSEIDNNRVLARYMHSLSKKFTVAASIESPNNKIPTTSQYSTINTSIPDVAAFLQYTYQKQHIRLSGIVKTLGYRNLVTAQNHHLTGWGVNLSTKLHLAYPLALYAAVNTGEGISSLVNDLSYGQCDLLGLSTDPGQMYAPRSFGYYGALQYHYSPTVFSTVIFSHERILPRATAEYGGSDYKYGLYGTANVFWNIAPRVQVGAEFNVGKRCNMDGDGHVSYRASMSAEFSF